MLRFVTVSVPDNNDAEASMHKAAATLRDGFELGIIPIPGHLGMEHAGALAPIFIEAQAKVSVVAAIVKAGLPMSAAIEA